MKINNKMHIRKKGPGAGKPRKNPAGKGFRVYNMTDGINASPESFPTRKAAQEFIKRFRERFKSQGYYKTASGQRISPEQVQLAIIPGWWNNANR